MKFFLWSTVCLLLAAAAMAEEATLKTHSSIEFLSKAAGSELIVGKENDEFFSRLLPREVAAMTGSPRGEQTREQSRQFAREFFRDAVLEFDSDEKESLRSAVHGVVKRFGDDYPLLVHHAWKFIKARRDLCGGFSFTRGDCIVLSESTLAWIVKLGSQHPNSESLLLHEQMHVVQREQSARFRFLYERLFAFRSATVNLHPWVDERQITNPDGTDDNWVADVRQIDGKTASYWLGTLLLNEKPLHVMGQDFSSVAVPVARLESGDYEMVLDDKGVPRYQLLEELVEFTSRLPIRGGYDHPNEVAAYLFTQVTHGQLPPGSTAEATQVFNNATAWFKANLKPQPDSAN